MDSANRIVFTDTEIAFAYKNNWQLQRAVWLFRFMNHGFWVRLFSNLGKWGLRFHFPLVKAIIFRTVYRQFVGGANLQQCIPVIETLDEHNCLVVLDFAAEGKQEEARLDATRDQLIRTIQFAANKPSVPVVTVKISGLAQTNVLRAWSESSLQEYGFEEKYQRIVQRLTTLCNCAEEYGVKIFLDAEESWIQDAIDHLATEMMNKYNEEKVIVYNTFQMYRYDRLDYLKNCFEVSRNEGYILGVKLVRGAFMEKERERAHRKNYPCPIYGSREEVDRDYNEALLFCAGRYEDIALCAATHNLISCQMLAEYILELPARKDHPHLNFCQLYGMGDDITFNLAHSGFNVAKYLPYGPVQEVFPSLIRRAEENKAMSNEFNREYHLIRKELERRRRGNL